MEESERKRIEDAKTLERRNAMEELESWKSSQPKQPSFSTTAPARSRVVGIERLDGPLLSQSASATASNGTATAPEKTNGTATTPEKTGAASRRAAEAVPTPPAAGAARDEKAIFAEAPSSAVVATAPKDAQQQQKPKEKVVPPVRATTRIGMSFTPRVFPTPSRESQAPQEEEVNILLPT